MLTISTFYNPLFLISINVTFLTHAISHLLKSCILAFFAALRNSKIAIMGSLSTAIVIFLLMSVTDAASLSPDGWHQIFIYFINRTPYNITIINLYQNYGAISHEHDQETIKLIRPRSGTYISFQPALITSSKSSSMAKLSAAVIVSVSFPNEPCMFHNLSLSRVTIIEFYPSSNKQ